MASPWFGTQIWSFSIYSWCSFFGSQWYWAIPISLRCPAVLLPGSTHLGWNRLTSSASSHPRKGRKGQACQSNLRNEPKSRHQWARGKSSKIWTMICAGIVKDFEPYRVHFISMLRDVQEPTRGTYYLPRLHVRHILSKFIDYPPVIRGCTF